MPKQKKNYKKPVKFLKLCPRDLSKPSSVLTIQNIKKTESKARVRTKIILFWGYYCSFKRKRLTLPFRGFFHKNAVNI